jgi:hypothetical protein
VAEQRRRLCGHGGSFEFELLQILQVTVGGKWARFPQHKAIVCNVTNRDRRLGSGFVVVMHLVHFEASMIVDADPPRSHTAATGNCMLMPSWARFGFKIDTYALRAALRF